jgi:hypothetical protein
MCFLWISVANADQECMLIKNSDPVMWNIWKGFMCFSKAREFVSNVLKQF